MTLQTLLKEKNVRHSEMDMEEFTLNTKNFLILNCCRQESEEGLPSWEWAAPGSVFCFSASSAWPAACWESSVPANEQLSGLCCFSVRTSSSSFAIMSLRNHFEGVINATTESSMFSDRRHVCVGSAEFKHLCFCFTITDIHRNPELL